MEIPAPLAEPTMFAGWMTALHTFITQPVPEVCVWGEIPVHDVRTSAFRKHRALL